MKIARFEFNPFGEITYVVYDETTCEAAVIDPGMSNEAERTMFDGFILRNHLILKYMLFTHMHVDHTFGSGHIQSVYGLKVTAHQGDAYLGLGRPEQAQRFRLSVDLDPLVIDRQVAHGDKIKIGSEYLEVIHVPGHSKGSVAFYCASSDFVITGDALFRSSIGRTDLPGGNHAELVQSITEHLLTLPPNTIVYPGHGPATTIEHERRFNPYL